MVYPKINSSADHGLSLAGDRFGAHAHRSGFAIVVTLSMIVLLTMLCVSMLSMASVSTKGSAQHESAIEARANARLALGIALGELQKEMGPDMRVSAESAILDSNKSTVVIDGLEQSRWMASYDSWGNWLNDDYVRPGTSNLLTIQDTYQEGREPMFRRWMLSLPDGSESNLDAPKSLGGLDQDRLVVMVGEGSTGIDPNNPSADDEADKITKAYLKNINGEGRYAWWIGPENHRAKMTLADESRTLALSDWEISHGNAAEMGVDAVDGFEFLGTGADIAEKILTFGTLETAGANTQDAKDRFFDFTPSSKGVLASVRTGTLKKDLSLLFEQPSSALPEPYRFVSSDTQEPSIRPMSPDLLAAGPYFPMRHFQSWTNMRHFYRMYRQSSDANTGGGNGTGGAGSLLWDGNKPWTNVAMMKNCDNDNWTGSNLYWRYPVVAKFTYIFSLVAQPSSFGGRYELYVAYTPVVTYWNPYNVELRIPDRSLGAFTGSPRAWPMSAKFYTRNPSTGQHELHAINDQTNINYQIGNPTYRNNVVTWLSSGDGSDIVFKPGQMRCFSLKAWTRAPRSEWQHYDMVPGFDPLGIVGGDMLRIPRIYYINQEPAVALRFGINGWVFNINTGNTPGSLTYCQLWGDGAAERIQGNPPMLYMHDWFRADEDNPNRKESESFTLITEDPYDVGRVATRPGNLQRWVFDGAPHPFAYAQMVLKTSSPFEYESIDWPVKDWRSRNWIQSPPQYKGNATYISDDLVTANTQRWDCPYSVNFGPLYSLGDAVALVDPFTDDSIAKLGSGATPVEQVSELAQLELPTAPISSLAGFSGMQITPGWVDPEAMVDHSNNPKLRMRRLAGVNTPVEEASAWLAEGKLHAYQSGVTGPAIGNSFMHPQLDRTGVYSDFSNSTSLDPTVRQEPDNYKTNDLKVFRDHWDHVFLLNDALWDDYFLSSLADQTRPGASSADSLSENLDALFSNELLNSRYVYHDGEKTVNQARASLQDADGYLKAAAHLMVDGMFNVNSTSVDAWYALFAGIRERKAVYRDDQGSLREIEVPNDKAIALTRFNTEVSNQENQSPEMGASMPSGWQGWSGLRFLDDDQLYKLAEECVKQVKLRGPFLNFSEFINRRLSDDALGTIGALQAAIDYDNENPESGSINYMFKSDSEYMVENDDLVGFDIETPEAAVGSRFAGVPGYVIQSDLLKPLGNVLSVRDDTFRVRTYGESLDENGNVLARAWCEAIIQRVPEYVDSDDEAYVPAREISSQGTFVDNSTLSVINRKFGRKFKIVSFRWLDESEI